MIKGQDMGPESLNVQYKDYAYPWDRKRKNIISMCICAFLNKQGGMILIGIKETKQLKWIVKGFQQNQEKIEQIIKDLTNIVQGISISAIINNLVKIKLAPIINPASKRGKSHYVVKITIQKGWLQNLSKLYFFNGNNFFRTENQVKCYNNTNDLNEIRVWRIETIMQEMRKEKKTARS